MPHEILSRERQPEDGGAFQLLGNCHAIQLAEKDPGGMAFCLPSRDGDDSNSHPLCKLLLGLPEMFAEIVNIVGI